LLGAEVGLGDNFAVEGVEVELMREGEVIFMAFHIFIELLLAGEGMLEHHCVLLRELIPHDCLALAQPADELVVLELGFAGRALAEGDSFGVAHLSIIIINE
jgi:hypothetical protein